MDMVYHPYECNTKCSMNLIIKKSQWKDESLLSGLFQHLERYEAKLNATAKTQENCSLLQEIRDINNLLIDSEIVIGEKDSILSAAGGAAEHGEGLVIKFVFNAVTVNQNLHLSSDKKSIIKPLWLLVPTSYPFSPPVILEMLSEVSEGLGDLSTIAKSNLIYSLQHLNQPRTLMNIATSWERCAREAILEYAQARGGGTFSSIYGGWEMCEKYF
uniref:ARC105/Med15 mediator subunit C-terminal domain-containing protein n=1 Tax=Cajanus cajan TaxID=3821 RepID=A0A151QQX8_CAJCA|nr:hypothetical protein KK1_046564 [Cajanus cajan]